MSRAERSTASAVQDAPRALRDMTVAVLGTGRMGSAMASTLARADAQVVVYNRTRRRAEDLAEKIGAVVAGSPAEAAADADVLITMVADDDAVVTLYRQPAGILEGLAARTVALDMSTVLPDTVRGLATDVRARGAGLLDAPVSGSVTLAEAGELTIMAGGDAADLERARPALEGLSGRIFHVGPLGAGATMKLAVNAIIFGLSNAVAEALVLAERAGVDRALAYEVFGASAVGSPFVAYKRDAFLEPTGTPVAFSVTLAQKDLRLILELAERVGIELPQARTNLELLSRTATDVGADHDFSSVAEHLRAGRVDMA
jgi:3-hydroxyisobutyrate dehydrogenase-like beta-hydroxyacid dehydrogenase